MNDSIRWVRLELALNGSSFKLADQTYGSRDQVGVIPCGAAIGQQRDILQPRADSMPSLEGTPIDCPTG